MWRRNTLAMIANTIIHYFKPDSNQIHLYDVIKKVQIQIEIDRIIPNDCKTIAVDLENIFIIGVQKDTVNQNITWVFNRLN